MIGFAVPGLAQGVWYKLLGGFLLKGYEKWQVSVAARSVGSEGNED